MEEQKLDLEKIFNTANVKIGEEFYSSYYGWVIYDGISRYMGTTLLDFKYCPEQFEILGITSSFDKNEKN